MQSNQGSPTDNTPRHWRGMPGNRLEHTNVWVIGGRPQSYRPEISRPDTTTTSSVNSATITNDPITSSMNMRRESNASDASGTSTTTNTTANANTNTNTNTTNVGGRRRSSASGNPSLFYNLANQKRNSQDPSMMERRASWTEQMQKGGVLSQWWNGYTRGH